MFGLLAAAPVAPAATYFVATTGDDARTALQAQNSSTPWQTIQKAADNMSVAGDVCVIRGGTYRETVQVKVSGTAAAPITFQAYNGETVTVDGTEVVSGWSDTGSNIWAAAMGWTLGDGNQVFVDGAMKPEARWPNAGPGFPWQDSSLAHPTFNELGDWSYVNSAGYTDNTNGWFADAQLPERPDGYWSGAIVNIVSGDGWYMASLNAIGYSNELKRITTDDARGSSSAYAIKAGNEFYLTGKKGELDSVGEWFYDASVSNLCLVATNAPAGVAAKKRSYGFNLSGRSNIKLERLSFFACTVQTDANSASNSYDGLAMRYLGHSRKMNASVYGLSLRTGDVLRNSELAWDAVGLVRLLGSSIRVINNSLHDSGYMPNVEMLGFGSGTRSGNLISHNTLRRGGRALIGFVGRACIVEYNDLGDGMRLTTDGALFNTASEAGNTIVRYNLIHDAPGPAGHSGAQVMGFYLDCQNSNWIVHHNVIWGVAGYAMQVNATQNFNALFNNTCWNTTRGSLVTSFPMNEESGTHVFNNLFNGALAGTQKTWDLTDARYNLFTDPLFVAPATNFQLQARSSGIDAGTPIPGVTDGFSGAAPDIGALEQGCPDWTGSAGYSPTPPTPDPVCRFPAMSFANQVQDGSFESGALAPNWTLSAGGSASLLSGNAWTDTRLRSASRSLQFGAGTTEVRQVVSGLLPGRRYKVYGGVRNTNATAVVKLGVRNYGYAPLERVADVINRSAPLAVNESRNGDAAWWTVYNQSFVTGPSSSNAEIYLSVVLPAAAGPVFADDFGVTLMQEPDPQSAAVPVLHYALNESSGSLAADDSIFGRNGTVYGSAAWVDGVYSSALSFNGTNAYLLSPVMASPTSAVTVSCWAKSNTTNWNESGFLVSKRPSFVLHPNMGSKNVRFFVITGGVSQTVTFTAPANFDITQWHHYAGTYSSALGKLCLYVDGELASSATCWGAIDADSGPVFVGKDDYTGRYFDGSIDDVRLYDQALSAQDVEGACYADASLMVRLRLDETSGVARAWDASGNGNGGSLTHMDAAAAWGSGRVEGALRFDGVDDAVDTAPLGNPVSAVTVACWAKSAAPDWSSGGALVFKRRAFVLRPDARTQKMGFQVVAGGVTSTVSAATLSGFDVSAWHHYAGVYDGIAGTLSLYLDGVLRATVAASGAFEADDGPIVLGRDDSTGACFSGSLDDVQVYSRALRWDEVLALSVRVNGPPYAEPLSQARSVYELPYRESFERYTYAPNAALPGFGGWSSERADAAQVVTNAVPLDSLRAYDQPAGYPLRFEEHEQAALFKHTVTNRVTSPTNTAVWVDMMAELTRMDTSVAEVETEAHSAVCLDSAGRLNVWHRDVAGGTNRWTVLAWQTAQTAQWVRVTEHLDYAMLDALHNARYFRLFIDGVEQTSPLAFSSNSGGGAPGGAWFAMAAPAPSKMNNLIFCGKGAMDDLAVDTARPLIGLGPRGTPEWWLSDHGLTNQSTLAGNELDDADNDHFANWQEYAAATDPADPESLLRFMRLEGAQQGRLPLVVQVVPGLRYSLESSAGLSTNAWESAAFGLTPSDTPALQAVKAVAASLTLYVEPDSFFRVYRVVRVP